MFGRFAGNNFNVVRTSFVKHRKFGRAHFYKVNSENFVINGYCNLVAFAADFFQDGLTPFDIQFKFHAFSLICFSGICISFCVSAC